MFMCIFFSAYEMVVARVHGVVSDVIVVIEGKTIEVHLFDKYLGSWVRKPMKDGS